MNSTRLNQEEHNLTGEEFFARVNETISNLGLDLKHLKSNPDVTTDGGKNMSSTKLETFVAL